MNLWIEVLKFLLYSILIVLISKYILVRILRKIGELLRLKPKTIGNIAGVATSIPELLTASFSAMSGFILTSTYNIISSNVINVIQYMFTVFLNKNSKTLKNRALQIDLILVLFTILIPIFMRIFHFETQGILIPVFILLLFVFYRITNNAHRLYSEKSKDNNEKEEEEGEAEKQENQSNIRIYSKKEISSVVWQAILLAIVGMVLYGIGNLLSDVLENLCIWFEVPEFILGILLGFITSIPEFITFLESQRHHEEDLEGVVEATSNLLTSNIMNLFVIQSIAILLFRIFL